MVLSILVVSSIITKGPIIFLRLSEKAVGEFDGMFMSRANQNVVSFNSFLDEGYYLNYQVVK